MDRALAIVKAAMNRKLRVGFALLLVLLVARGLFSGAADSGALVYLKTHLASLQQVLADPGLAGSQHSAQRRKLARVVLQQFFDFHAMARASLGAHARIYDHRMNEFTPLFIDFLEHAYMATLEDNGDAEIRYLSENLHVDDLVIKTKTRLRDGSEYGVDYKFLAGAAGWRTYDVIVEGFSLVDNYRAQFDRVLRKKSFDQLLEDLRDKKQSFS